MPFVDNSLHSSHPYSDNLTPHATGDSFSDADLKVLILHIKQQNYQIHGTQNDLLQRLVQNSEEIAELKLVNSELKSENTELKNQINAINEDVIRLDQYSRKDVSILTGLKYSPGESQYELQNNVIQTINSITGKKLNDRDFVAVHRNGNRIKDNGRPPSVTVKFVRSTDKEILFGKSVINRRKASFPSINFHHCLCKSLINVQSRISEHCDVKFVRYMGDRKYFDVCVKLQEEGCDDFFLTRIRDYNHFIAELDKYRLECQIN